jgi:hypothetical protein
VILGDLTVAGDFPAKVMKALAAIADALHPAFDRQDWIAPGWSKQSCVLTSLTCRDFLAGLGFIDAVVSPCALVVRAEEAGRELHSLGVGDIPGQPATPAGRWNGHMVVTVPSVRLLLDTTIYQSIRPQWPALTGMMATQLLAQPASFTVYGKHPIAGIELREEDRAYAVNVLWLDDRSNRVWRRGGDAQEWRRQVTLGALRDSFGEWRDWMPVENA